MRTHLFFDLFDASPSSGKLRAVAKRSSERFATCSGLAVCRTLRALRALGERQQIGEAVFELAQEGGCVLAYPRKLQRGRRCWDAVQREPSGRSAGDRVELNAAVDRQVAELPDRYGACS